MTGTMGRIISTSLLASSLAVAAGGCKAGKKEGKPPAAPTTVPAPKENWTDQPLAVPPQPVRPVKEGPLPLVFMVETASSVRVVDATSSEDLLRLPVPARTIISVDPRTGIRIGGATMKLGPLPADHRYAIYLESSESNIVRRGTIRPGTQPARRMQP